MDSDRYSNSLRAYVRDMLCDGEVLLPMLRQIGAGGENIHTKKRMMAMRDKLWAELGIPEGLRGELR